jgi:ribosomal subunit interface protein
MFPIQITTKDVSLSPAIETFVRERADKLSRFCDGVINFHVVIGSPEKRKHQGKLYNVRIDTTVPGKELVVTKKQGEDLYAAIRDAFNAMQRKMEEYLDKRRHHVKTHILPDSEK